MDSHQRRKARRADRRRGIVRVYRGSSIRITWAVGEQITFITDGAGRRLEHDIPPPSIPPIVESYRGIDLAFVDSGGFYCDVFDRVSAQISPGRGDLFFTTEARPQSPSDPWWEELLSKPWSGGWVELRQAIRDIRDMARTGRPRPRERHDDIVDAMLYAHGYIQTNTTRYAARAEAIGIPIERVQAIASRTTASVGEVLATLETLHRNLHRPGGA